MKEEYPEIIDWNEIEDYEGYESFDGRTWEEDYSNAEHFAEINGGMVYTVVNDEGDKCYYIKGNSKVDRLGYCVIKKEEFK